MLDVQIKEEITDDDHNGDEETLVTDNNVIDAAVEENASRSDNADNDTDSHEKRKIDHDEPANVAAVGASKRLRFNGRIYPVQIHAPRSATNSTGTSARIMCKQPEKLLRPQRLAHMRQASIQHIQQRGQVRISRVTSAAFANEQRVRHQMLQHSSSPLPSTQQRQQTSPPMRAPEFNHGQSTGNKRKIHLANTH